MENMNETILLSNYIYIYIHIYIYNTIQYNTIQYNIKVKFYKKLI